MHNMNCYALLNATDFVYSQTEKLLAVCYRLATSSLSVIIDSKNQGGIIYADEAEPCSQQHVANMHITEESINMASIIDVPLFWDSKKLVVYDNASLVSQDGNNDTFSVVRDVFGLGGGTRHEGFDDNDWFDYCPSNEASNDYYGIPLPLIISTAVGLGIVASAVGGYCLYNCNKKQKHLEFKLRSLVSEISEKQPEIREAMEGVLERNFSLKQLKIDVAYLEDYKMQNGENDMGVPPTGESAETPF